MRAIGLDVHLEFCEVAIAEGGEVRSAGRIETKPAELELFAQSLGKTDRVALEVTGNAWEIKRLLEPHVGEVVVVSPGDTGIRSARAKTDRLDARTLARLLPRASSTRSGSPTDRTQVMRRRLQRRSQLVAARTRAKNEIHAALMRQLVGRSPFTDLFGKKGRALAGRARARRGERESVDAALRQIEFLDSEIAEVERLIAAEALGWPEVRRLMTVPGVNVISRRRSWRRSATSRGLRTRESSSATSGSTPRSASRARARRPTGGSQSRALRAPATRWSRRAGRRSASPVRCAPSISASRRAAATRSRSSPRRESSPACFGVCSRAQRTTPSASPR